MIINPNRFVNVVLLTEPSKDQRARLHQAVAAAVSAAAAVAATATVATATLAAAVTSSLVVRSTWLHQM